MAKLSIDPDLVREIADILHEKDLAEIEWSEDGVQMRIARSMPAPAPAPAAWYPPPAAGPVRAADGAAPATPGAADPGSHPGAVKSPMVGTAYTAPEPGAPPYVQVGDEVSQGQTLLIVEAMKTMNPIPAPRSGRLVQILVENEEPVEFDQVLMVIE
ncbi:acetyl-CoA carboxylase biotin carboxyl carrier protein [Marinibaculum pumilum]|uniref:Biotin carboxyl carrier protein of acetyl-CoA carboxylase n=1 Tax=Marinibaculum pumilum TaxID=1766165 RepID=A0ABV7KYZ6_9PROT